MPTRICIIRHGETDWNVEKRIQGHLDIPLNQTGRAQALATAQSAFHYAFQAIYSSDLSRTLDTANAVAKRLALEVQPLALLRERHYGIFQGLTALEEVFLNGCTGLTKGSITALEAAHPNTIILSDYDGRR